MVNNSDMKKPLKNQGFKKAIDGARTRGLDLGKVARYQLRHYRMYYCLYQTYIILHDFYYPVNCFFDFIKTM